MKPDYGAGIGIGFFLIMIVIYLGILALALWINYLIMRTAVKNGMLLAMQQSGQQFPPGGYLPPASPYQGPPAQPPYSGPPAP